MAIKLTHSRIMTGDHLIPSNARWDMASPVFVRDIYKQPGAGEYGEDVYEQTLSAAQMYYDARLLNSAQGTLSFRFLMQPSGLDGYILRTQGPFADGIAFGWFQDDGYGFWWVFGNWQSEIWWPPTIIRSDWHMLTVTWAEDGTAAFIVDDLVAGPTPLSRPQLTERPLFLGRGPSNTDGRATHISDLLILPQYTPPAIVQQWYSQPRSTYENAIAQWGTPPPRASKHYAPLGGFLL